MYRVAAFDMDGTLLMRNHQIGDATRTVLNQLVDKGMIITYATGRHYLDMRLIAEHIDLKGYFITGNGTRVHDQQGRLLHAVDLPEAVVDKLLTSDWQTPSSLHLYRDEGWFTNHADEDYPLAGQSDHFGYHLVQFDQVARTGNSKAAFIGPHEQLDELKARLDAAFPGQLNICFSAVGCLDIMPLGCNKGTALARLSQHLGMSPADCMAFGDAMNDKEMLESVGNGLVMGNALPQLKQALSHLPVIGNCENQAVAHYLHHWLHTPHLTYSPEF